MVESFSCAGAGERDEVLAQSPSTSPRSSMPRLSVKTFSFEGFPAWGQVGYSFEDKPRVGRMSIRLPGLTRRSRSRSESAGGASASSSAGSRGILRRNSSSDGKRSANEDDADGDEDEDSLPELLHSPTTTSFSPPLSPLSCSPAELSTSPLATALSAGGGPPLQRTSSHTGTSLPLNACCIRCERASEWGLANNKERFTPGAKRLQAAEVRRQAEEEDRRREKGLPPIGGGGAVTASQQAILDKRAKWENKPAAGATTVKAEVADEVVPLLKGRKKVAAVDELVTARRDQRQEARDADRNRCVAWCANPDETIGFDVLERRVPGSPTIELPSSPLVAPEAAGPAAPAPATTPVAEEAAAVAPSTTASAVTRPPPPARVHSSADDILPAQATTTSSKPAPPRRKFSLSLFGAFGDAGARTF